MMRSCPDRGQEVLVGVVSSHEVVVAGIRALVGELHGNVRIMAVGDKAKPAVVLYDVIGLREGDGTDLDHWVHEPDVVVIALGRELRPDLGAVALQHGARAAVSLCATVEEILEVIEAAVSGTLDGSRVAREAAHRMQLGVEAGLTLREAQTLGLIVRGLSNHEIAEACGLSINSVKSYIRNAYRKMCVESRSQAVAWGIQHGFAIQANQDAAVIAVR